MKVRVFNKTWLCLAVIIVAAAIVYSNTLDAPFVFDDHLQIVENTRIKNLDYHLSLERLTSQRPLTNLTFALNYHLHGLDVWGYHFVNLLVHILAGITVFFLALIVFRSLLQKNSPVESEYSDFQIRLMALFTALIFVVHPLQTQAVTYIVQRYTSMAAMFYLMAVLLYILARQGQIRGLSPARYIPLFLLCLFSGALAFLSKQSAASLPGILILTEFMLFTHGSQAWRKKLSWIIPLSCVFLVFVFYNTGVFSGKIDFGSLLEDVSSRMQETSSVGRLEYLFTQFTVIPLYIKLFLFPVGLNADPMLPFAKSFFDGFTPWGFLLLLSIIIVGVMARKRYPIIFFSVFWFFITMSVESSIIPIRDAMFEHRMYLPLFAPALICGWVLGLTFHKRPLPTMIFVLMLTITLGWLTYKRNAVWKNDHTLWADVLEKNPENHRAYTNLGMSLELAGRKKQASLHYYQALELNPDYAYAHLNLGSLLGQQGRTLEAEYHFRRARETAPDNPKILSNLGVSLAVQGNFNEALELFREAVRLDRFFIEARFNLALTLVNLQQYDQASIELRSLLSLDQDNLAAGNLLQNLENR